MIQPYKKKLIEVAIPIEAINAASAYEKLPGIGPHPRGIHLWWARRPHAATRSILFSQLVDDPSSHPDKFPTLEAQEEERARLFKIIEELGKWENSENLNILNEARNEIERSCEGGVPTIYDPFAGGGSIPIEAVRLGLKAYGSDLNPVAATVVKAMIEVFPQFAGRQPVHRGPRERSMYDGLEGLVEDFQYYGDLWCGLVRKKVGHLYPAVDVPKQFGDGKGKVVAWIWARTVPSPDPALGGLPVPLIRSFDLSTKKGKRSWVEPVVDGKNYRFEVKSEQFGDRGTAPKGTVNRQGGRCLVSGAAMPLSYIREQAKEGRIGHTLVAIAVERSGGKIYLPPDCDPTEVGTRFPGDDMPTGTIEHWPGCTNCVVYGMTDFSMLFNERQATSLLAFSNSIPDILAFVEEDFAERSSGDEWRQISKEEFSEYKKSIAILLSFSLDRALDFNNMMTGWAPSNEKVMHLFSRHAIPMVWDYGEANILEDVVGGMPGIIKYQAKCINKLPHHGTGIGLQADARLVDYPDNAVVSTDPPYYDNVPYSNLSDFFYIWMKKNLGDFLPEMFATVLVPKQDELVANQFRYGSKESAEDHFLSGMKDAISRIAQQSSGEFPVSVYYAFKQSEIEAEGLSSTGWATFLSAIIESGLTVDRTWPVRTESSSRLRAIGSNALANSVVLVCRKRKNTASVATRAEFVRALKRELPPAIAELQAANVSPADMPQSAIGPGMGVFSRHKAVLEADDNPMTVKTALQLINTELDEFLNDLQGEFDADTRFAVTWFEQHGYNKGDYGAADNLARARGISVDSVKHAGVVESSAGKVRILKRPELDPDWNPIEDDHLTIWECCQHLIRVLENEGEYSAAVLLKNIGSEKAEMVKDLAYYLYEVCSTKRQDAKEATSYNGLIAVWTELTRQAASVRIEDQNHQTAMDI